jgi:hypothetical protein
MRHSDIKLSLQVYTDVQQLDEVSAIAALPRLRSAPEYRG